MQALEGLRVILGVRPQTLSTMVPKLLRGTLTSTNCRALGSLAEVAGAAIAPHLSHVFPPMLRLASQPESSSPATAAAKDCLDKVCVFIIVSAVSAMCPYVKGVLSPPESNSPAIAAAKECLDTVCILLSVLMSTFFLLRLVNATDNTSANIAAVYTCLDNLLACPTMVLAAQGDCLMRVSLSSL